MGLCGGSVVPNPFYHGNPVAPDQFLDRRGELRRLVNRIVNRGQSSAVVGEPRTGKTSLLEYLAAQDTRMQLYGQEEKSFSFPFWMHRHWEDSLPRHSFGSLPCSRFAIGSSTSIQTIRWRRPTRSVERTILARLSWNAFWPKLRKWVGVLF